MHPIVVVLFFYYMIYGKTDECKDTKGVIRIR